MLLSRSSELQIWNKFELHGKRIGCSRTIMFENDFYAIYLYNRLISFFEFKSFENFYLFMIRRTQVLIRQIDYKFGTNLNRVFKNDYVQKRFLYNFF